MTQGLNDCRISHQTLQFGFSNLKLISLCLNRGASGKNNLQVWLFVRLKLLFISDTGAQNTSLVVFGFFLLIHILLCICFKVLFTG